MKDLVATSGNDQSIGLLHSTPVGQQRVKVLVEIANTKTLGKYWGLIIDGQLGALALIPSVRVDIYNKNTFSKYREDVHRLFKAHGRLVTGEVKEEMDKSTFFVEKPLDIKDKDYARYPLNSTHKIILKEGEGGEVGRFFNNKPSIGRCWAATNDGYIAALISMPNFLHIQNDYARKSMFDTFRRDARKILSHLGYVISGDICRDAKDQRVFLQIHNNYQKEDNSIERQKLVIYRLPGYLR